MEVQSFLLLYFAESSVGVCRREEFTQHTAKLQLCVRAKSRRHFEKTYMSAMFLNIINTDFNFRIPSGVHPR